MQSILSTLLSRRQVGIVIELVLNLTPCRNSAGFFCKFVSCAVARGYFLYAQTNMQCSSMATYSLTAGDCLADTNWAISSFPGTWNQTAYTPVFPQENEQKTLFGLPEETQTFLHVQSFSRWDRTVHSLEVRYSHRHSLCSTTPVGRCAMMHLPLRVSCKTCSCEVTGIFHSTRVAWKSCRLLDSV